MHGYSRLGGARNGSSSSSSPQFRHGQSKSNGWANGFVGSGIRGSKERTMEKLLFGLMSAVFRRRGLLFFAPLLYISGMLLYMGSLNFDAVKNGLVFVHKRAPPGSVYRSPQVFEKLWHSMESESSNGSVNAEIKDIQVRGNKQIEKQWLRKYCPTQCISSYKVGKNVAKILRKVDELETEGEQFCRDFKIALKHLHNPNEMPCGETVGLDLMIPKVLESIEKENVGIVGLYGMGGVGKTTLLKKINNELVKRSGLYILWVVVSKSPNLDSIMDNIRDLVGIGDDVWNHCSNQDGKAAKIYKVLKKKKFVLLLDDIWDRLDLEKVGVPHPKESNFQSKVLFTTRCEDVCAKMEAQREFKVEVLTEKEAFELFCMKVGEETLKSNPAIRNIAQKMARECKGLPLALNVVGSAMAGLKSVETWEHSINNLTSSSSAASDFQTKVFFVLKFSYDQLPDETHKKCFLYCALYPEDYAIPVINLIFKWIGEGFLDNDGMRSVHDMRCHGKSIIEKLKLSCLLLETVENNFFFAPLVKMHDVMRDMALWIARDQDRKKKKIVVQEDAHAISQANVENWEMVERISILNGVESWIQSKSWTSLKTLLLGFKYDCAINGLQNIQHASQLKVLELSRVKIVSAKGIGGLNLLEFLSLKVTGLTNASDLWRELKNLKNLKVFRLVLHVDNVIPLGLISNLHKLKVFTFETEGVRDEREEEEFVEELECSSNLEELGMEITTQSGLNKLLKSAKLQSYIYSLYLRHVGGQVNGPLRLAIMSKMKHLEHLSLRHLKNMIDLSVCDTCCLSTLQTVLISKCDTIHHLTWLKYAPLLRQFSVSSCLSIEEVIKGEIILEEDEKDTIFPSLEKLKLLRLPNLRSIHEGVLSFPSLRSIEVFHCENLKKLPFDSNSAKTKLRRIKGDEEWWKNLKWDDPIAKTTFHSKFEVFHH